MVTLWKGRRGTASLNRISWTDIVPDVRAPRFITILAGLTETAVATLTPHQSDCPFRAPRLRRQRTKAAPPASNAAAADVPGSGTGEPEEYVR